VCCADHGSAQDSLGVRVLRCQVEVIDEDIHFYQSVSVHRERRVAGDPHPDLRPGLMRTDIPRAYIAELDYGHRLIVTANISQAFDPAAPPAQWGDARHHLIKVVARSLPPADFARAHPGAAVFARFRWDPELPPPGEAIEAMQASCRAAAHPRRPRLHLRKSKTATFRSWTHSMTPVVSDLWGLRRQPAAWQPRCCGAACAADLRGAAGAADAGGGAWPRRRALQRLAGAVRARELPAHHAPRGAARAAADVPDGRRVPVGIQPARELGAPRGERAGPARQDRGVARGDGVERRDGCSCDPALGARAARAGAGRPGPDEVLGLLNLTHISEANESEWPHRLVTAARTKARQSSIMSFSHSNCIQAASAPLPVVLAFSDVLIFFALFEFILVRLARAPHLHSL